MERFNGRPPDLGNVRAEEVASLRLDLDLPRDIELDNSDRLQLVATDLDKTNHHAESVLSIEIWDPIDLDGAFIFDRIEKPISDEDGNTPKSNDYRLVVGLSIEF